MNKKGRGWLINKNYRQILLSVIKSISGIRNRAAVWKAQTNPLSSDERDFRLCQQSDEATSLKMQKSNRSNQVSIQFT